jgi:hypothetical protein
MKVQLGKESTTASWMQSIWTEHGELSRRTFRPKHRIGSWCGLALPPRADANGWSIGKADSSQPYLVPPQILQRHRRIPLIISFHTQMNNNWGGHFLTLVAINMTNTSGHVPFHSTTVPTQGASVTRSPWAQVSSREVSARFHSLTCWTLLWMSAFVTPREDSVNIRQFALSRWPTRNIKKHCMGKRVKDVERERKARNPLFNVRQSPVKLPALRLWSFVHLLVASGAVHLLKQRLISVSIYSRYKNLTARTMHIWWNLCCSLAPTCELLNPTHLLLKCGGRFPSVSWQHQ